MTDLNLTHVASREDFLNQFRSHPPGLVLTTLSGISNLTLTEILQAAKNANMNVPVVVIRKEGDSQTEDELPPGVADAISIQQLNLLPSAIQRLLRGEESKIIQEQTKLDIQHAAEVIRDNQKLIAIGRLAASIAHEVNNPLEAVTNLLFLLRGETGLSPAGVNYLALAERELGRVVQISKQTLNFSRETLHPVRVELTNLLEEVLVLYARNIAQKQLKIVRQYKANDPLLLFPGEMRQVLSNLVTNAIEACAPGGKLYLRIRRSRKWSDVGITGMKIIIADTGCGIDDDARGRLGEIFFTTKGQGGTGLGLWVTKSIVQRYGGNIQVYSSTREGRHGTVFSVFMPTNMGPRVVKSGSDEDKEDVLSKFSTGGSRSRRVADGGDHVSESASYDYRRPGRSA